MGSGRGAAYLAVFLATFWATQASGQPPPRTALTPVPQGYFTAPGKSLDIKPVLSEDDAYDAVIGSEGGTMIAEGPDLTVYTLTIPAGALAKRTEITMTPLRSAGGLPFARGLVAGVHFAPNGTWLMRPARLSIRPRQTLAAAAVTPFAYGGQGEDMYLTPYRTEGDRIVVFLDHFSGQGLTLSTVQERALQMARTPLGIRERLSQQTADTIAEWNRNPGQGTGVWDAIAPVEKAYIREVLEPLRKLAATNCTMGGLHIMLSNSMERQRQLLGAGERAENDDVAPLDAGYVERCLKEQFEQCLQTGDYEGIAMWYMGYQRQLQLLSKDTSAADALLGKVNEYITRCARYEVEFDSTLIMASKLGAGGIGIIDVGPTSTSYAAALKAKAPVGFPKGSSPLTFTSASPIGKGESPGISGSGLLEYARYEMDGSGSSTLGLFQDSQGAHGFSNACTFKGVRTQPGLLTVVRVEPGFKNAEDRKYPLVAPTDTSAMAQAIRILRQLPQVGLLAAPRLVDPKATILWIAPQDAAEVERHTCTQNTGPANAEDRDATNWLDQWRRWRKQLTVLGPEGTVLVDSSGASVTTSALEGEAWSSVTDTDMRWHDSTSERSPVGTTLIEATAILRHRPGPTP